jgi:hypothetical protein
MDIGRLRPAKLDDYLFWLNGFLQRGGQPTDYYPFPMEHHSNFAFYEPGAQPLRLEGSIAHPSFIIVPGGSFAPIIESGIFMLFHVGIHAVEAKNIRPGHIVPVFNNPEFLEHPGLRDFWAQHPVG